jgi:hypothetical protein
MKSINPRPKEAYGAATHILPNNNILNIISKVKKSPYDGKVLELFKTREKTEFKFDEESLHIPNIIKRYKVYLQQNRDMMFKNVPRRKTDMKIFEAIYHFNIYRYLYDLLKKRGVEVLPEFPTGNGKIDLILKYRDKVYALELKSFKDMYDFRRGIEQAAEYGRQLGLKEIVFLVFVELKEEEVKELEQQIDKPGIQVIVIPIAIL